MLILLALFIAAIMALYFIFPVIAIIFAVLGVALYHFSIGYVLELWKIYKERQKT